MTALPRKTLHRFELAGSVIHAWIAGPTEGPLIALSHGASMDHQMFDQQLNDLTSAGYRVLVWDMRGHGKSKPMGRTPLSVRDLADDLLAILDSLGTDYPVCFGGHSLGGYVAQDIVLTHPDRVACLVIIGCSCMTLPLRRWESLALKSSPYMLRLFPEGYLHKLVAKSTALRPDVQEYALEATGKLNKQEFFQVWKAVSLAARPMPDYRIEQPLFLAHGDQDRAGNIAATSPRWAERDPICLYKVIPDASHNANQDNPEAFNHVLLNFLEQHYQQ